MKSRPKPVPSDQGQLHSSHHSIQIWSHFGSWIESVDKFRQEVVGEPFMACEHRYFTVFYNCLGTCYETCSVQIWNQQKLLTCCPVYLRPSKLTFHSISSVYCSSCPPQILTTKQDAEVSKRSGSMPKSRLRQVGFCRTEI